jgi:outer membrane protein, multidrug efflux system
MNKQTIALPVGIALLVASCVQGPNYERPELTTLLGSRFKRSAKPTPASDTPLPNDWWTKFGSPTLNGLVQKALSANQDLAGAKARVETARALVGARRADWFPDVASSAGVSAQRLSESAFGANLPAGFGSVSDLVRRDNFRATLDMNYELDLWGRVKRSVESARAGVEAADAQHDAQRLGIAAEVARHFFLLQSLDSQIQTLQSTIALRNEARELQKSRFDGGLGNELDVTRAQTEVELAKADLSVVERQRGSTEHALAVLCGQSPSSFTVPSLKSLSSSPVFSAGLPSTLLRSRPDIRAAEAQLRASCADVGVAEASLFPSFRLTGSAGFESIKATDFLNWENRVLSFGPSVSVPIVNRGRLKAGIRSAQSRYDEALASYKQAILLALREVEDSLLDLQSLSRQRTALEAAQNAAGETARLARLRQEKGLASYFEVVEAERTVLATRLALTQVQGQRLISSVLLAKALGGNWQSQ